MKGFGGIEELHAYDEKRIAEVEKLMKSAYRKKKNG